MYTFANILLYLPCMYNQKIDDSLIRKITKSDEKAFSELYNAYYTYLNTVAIYYLVQKEAANEVVNDVFLNIWNKRTVLTFPIHSYLIQSVKNGCLNYIRSQKSHNRVLEEHTKLMLDFQEEFILSNPTPFQYVESQEIEREVLKAVKLLPEKCRYVFEEFMFNGKSPEQIADEMQISVSTVRVQLKNAMDKLKVSLQHLLYIEIILLFRNFLLK